YHGVNVQVVAVPDYFVEHGSVKEQRQEVELTVENIASRVRALMPISKGVLEA
ncbi:1-deoxy-D-xylulose-5-phosphate synthase, partial [Citrobacter freundii ATCC 8090 = MTCC 1658 = NBRC 12681]